VCKGGIAQTQKCCLGTQVKPQYLDGVLEALQPHITPGHLIISIAAGVRLASLEANLPEGTRVVRKGLCLRVPCFTSYRCTSVSLKLDFPGADGANACADPGDAQHAVPHRPGSLRLRAWEPCDQ
jgi:hypothetical protein